MTTHKHTLTFEGDVPGSEMERAANLWTRGSLGHQRLAGGAENRRPLTLPFGGIMARLGGFASAIRV